MLDETTSIRVIPFSGILKSEYSPWKFKTSAIGSQYGWMEALQSDLTHPGITGVVLTDAIKEDQKTNGKVVTYLVLACKDKAFN
jgi:hypothetical protein